MKRVLLFLSVFTFILFASCEKDAGPDPNPLAQDLQNGYWQIDGDYWISVWKFDTSTISSYWIEGTPRCIVQKGTTAYTLEGNVMKKEANWDVPFTVEIQDNILTVDGDGFLLTFDRKSTLDYPDC